MRVILTNQIVYGFAQKKEQLNLLMMQLQMMILINAASISLNYWNKMVALKLLDLKKHNNCCAIRVSKQSLEIAQNAID